MSELLDLTKKQLTEEFEKQKAILLEQRDVADAVAALTLKYNIIIQQLEALETARVPGDLIDWFIKTQGKVFITKPAIVFDGPDSIQLYSNGRDILQRKLSLPTGLYRLVLIAIAEEEKPNEHGYIKDDFGQLAYKPVK